MENDREYKISTDSKDKPLSGEKFYRMRLQPLMPGCDFWSLLVYDTFTGMIIITDQPWPSVHSSCKKLNRNSDGSVDIFFGPEMLDGRTGNRIKTIPGKQWFSVLRFYGLQENDQTDWVPGKIEEIEPGV